MMRVSMKDFPISVDEYLEEEKSAEVKHEYVNGYVYAMVGSSRRHNILAVTLARLLGNHLHGSGCQVYVSDMNVRAGGKKDNIFYYPDVMVASGCGEQDRYVEDAPKVVIEVLSPSTEQHDRLSKLAAYTQVPSLEEYLLVDQDDMGIDLYRRNPKPDNERWQLNRLRAEDLLVLSSIHFEIPVVQVYQDIIGVI